MASEAQILTNRANAQKSTGPRTPEGKAVASQNAVTHGFLARETVIQGEDPGEFEFYRDWKLRDLAPVGGEETEMAERIVGLAWRLRRAERLQTEAFDALYEKMATASTAGGTPSELGREPGPDAAVGTGVGADRLLGRMLVEDFSHARVLEKLLLHERRIENSLYRSMRELREQKRMRLACAPAEEIERLPTRASRGSGISSAPLSEQALPVSWNHGRDAQATRKPTGVPMNVPVAQRSLCETNPIRAGMDESMVRGGERDGDDPLRDELCKTNPISRGDSSAPAAVRRVA